MGTTRGCSPGLALSCLIWRSPAVASARRRLLVGFVLVFLPATGNADDVLLKGGGKVSGRIVSQSTTSIELDVAAGRVILPASIVIAIEARRSALDDYHDRAGAFAADDSAGWLELARWASIQGLGTQSFRAHQRVLAADPGNGEANEALGRVLLDGRWMAEEEAYVALGYVRFEGEWKTDDERQAILLARAETEEAQQRQLETETRAREAAARRAQQAGGRRTAFRVPTSTSVLWLTMRARNDSEEVEPYPVLVIQWPPYPGQREVTTPGDCIQSSEPEVSNRVPRWSEGVFVWWSCP